MRSMHLIIKINIYFPLGNSYQVYMLSLEQKYLLGFSADLVTNNWQLDVAQNTWKRSLHWVTVFITLAHRRVCGGWSWLLMHVGGPSPLWVEAFAGQVVLDYVRKLTSEQAGKQHFSMASAPASCFGSCLHFPPLNVWAEETLLFPKLLLLQVFYHNSTKETRTNALFVTMLEKVISQHFATW